MTLPISNLPQGLVALLGSKGVGESPRLLADQLVGTLDLRAFFSFNTREVLVDSNAAPSVGGNIFTGLAVPAGEAWLVDFYNLDTSPGVGEAIDLCPSWAPRSTGQMSLGVYANATANENVRPFSQIVPFIANPGSTFGFNVRSLTLTPQVDAIIAFTRLKI